MIAVTGATGFIGRHFVARMAAAGRRVRAVMRPGSRRPPPEGASDTARVALTEAALARAFHGVDVVVHLAGCVRARSVDEFSRGNADATREVARAAAAAGARLVYVSSLAAAGPASPAAPRSETDSPAPLTPYGASKLAGERHVEAVEALRWTILRPGVVYGPQDAALLALFKMAQRGILPLVGRADAAYTFIHIDDMVRVLEAAVDRALDGRTLFVGHPAPVTARALVEGIRDAVGRPATIVPVPLGLTRAAAALAELTAHLTGRLMPLDRWRYAELAAVGFVCRVDRMRDLLNVEPAVDLNDGLARTAAWYREHGWLK